MKSFNLLNYFSCVIILSLFFVIGCKKDVSQADSSVRAEKYVGQYSVSEDTKILSNGSMQHFEFIGTVIKGDSSDWIRTIQSNRNPKPAWVGFTSDTISYKIYPLTDSIINPFGGSASGKIYNVDTIKLTYWYGFGAVAYQVNQVWIKIK